MEVISSNDGLLTNLDAILWIRERCKGRKKPSDPRASKQLAKHRDWIEKEVVRYLKELPASNETRSGVKAFLSALHEFSSGRHLSPFTQAERLQLINARPVAAVEIHLIIEACEERLTDEDVEALLEIVALHLGTTPEESSSVGQDVDGGSVNTLMGETGAGGGGGGAGGVVESSSTMEEETTGGGGEGI